MKVARRDFVVVSCGKYLWALDGTSKEWEALHSVEFYDVKKIDWKMSIPMITKRYSHSAVAFRNKIYVLGGKNKTSLDSAETFDTLTKQWTSIKSMNVPRRLFAAAVSGENIYCFGGLGKNKMLDSAESFNMITGVWKRERNFPQRADCFAAVTLYRS